MCVRLLPPLLLLFDSPLLLLLSHSAAVATTMTTLLQSQQQQAGGKEKKSHSSVPTFAHSTMGQGQPVSKPKLAPRWRPSTKGAYIAWPCYSHNGTSLQEACATPK